MYIRQIGDIVRIVGNDGSVVNYRICSDLVLRRVDPLGDDMSIYRRDDGYTCERVEIPELDMCILLEMVNGKLQRQAIFVGIMQGMDIAVTYQPRDWITRRFEKRVRIFGATGEFKKRATMYLKEKAVMEGLEG